jgi:hypothetical protein
MTIKYAKEIISAYGKLMSEAASNNLFQPKSRLPCSTAKVKFAIYRYINELIRLNGLNQQTAQSLIVAYSHLSFFVEEEMAHVMNAIARGKNNPTGDHLDLVNKHKEMIHMLALQKEYLNREIQEYINECLQSSRDTKEV